MTDKIKDHDRIWLEPAGAPDRCWCSDNQWGDEGIEYVRADLLRSAQASQAGEVEVVAWINEDALAELGKHKSATTTVASGLLKKPFGADVPLITLSSHQSIIAAKDAEITELRRERDELAYLHFERDQGDKVINERLEAAEARANAAEEAENEAKDCFWAIYPKYLEMGGEPVSTEAARTTLAERAKAAVDALTRIAEGNLGDDPWQANYARIKQVASEALKVMETSNG